MKPLLLTALTLAGFTLSALTPALAAPIVGTYNTAAAFTTAAPGAALETFTSNVAPARTNSPDSYDFGPFVASKSYNLLLPISGPSSGPAGAWRGRPTARLPDQFVFDEALRAWGADFTTSIGKEEDRGIALSILVEGNWYQVSTIGAGPDPDDTFFGFVSDTAFSAVRILSVSDRPRDAYLLDRMFHLTAAAESTSIKAVPEPAGLTLFAVSLLGIAGARRFGRRSRDALTRLTRWGAPQPK
ncbi:MAG TPA: PEP-CTERM sorting domain-containing protein [Falsiroseomonas sp.]|jgi:hypothetical protein|nr:PEP-CTERM sorting domain-containing protein [Falsiroseomonas sp.]